MPRVNRDLQRRMAARRERERRRPPAERRYRFASTEPALEEDEARTTANGEEAIADDATTQKETRSPRSRVSRTATLAAEPQAASTRGGVRTPRPFSDYAAEYAYVLTDLRRVALVIGSLLVLLLLLYFALPLLPH